MHVMSFAATPNQGSQELEEPQVVDEPECRAEEGDRWRYLCNWCSCRNGVGTCTRRICMDGEIQGTLLSLVLFLRPFSSCGLTSLLHT